MLSLILLKKILSLFAIMLCGYVLVRLGVVKSEDNRVLSTVCLYLISPCSILSAFSIDCTPEVLRGIMLAFGAAVVTLLLALVLSIPMQRFLHTDPVETDSVIYSNAGNLVIPIVAAVLGAEWVIYATGYLMAQLIFMWSHGKSLICGEKHMDWKKIVTNVNLIAVAAGMILFLTGIRFPSIVQDTVDTLGGMIGPVSMLVTGMLIAGQSLRTLASYPRMPLIVFLRLIVMPLFVIAFLRFTPLSGFAEQGTTILLITLIATITPSASTITQMAVVYGKNPEYACTINVFTTIGCIATMPVMVWLYQML